MGMAKLTPTEIDERVLSAPADKRVALRRTLESLGNSDLATKSSVDERTLNAILDRERREERSEEKVDSSAVPGFGKPGKVVLPPTPRVETAFRTRTIGTARTHNRERAVETPDAPKIKSERRATHRLILDAKDCNPDMLGHYLAELTEAEKFWSRRETMTATVVRMWIETLRGRQYRNANRQRPNRHGQKVDPGHHSPDLPYERITGTVPIRRDSSSLH